MLPASRFVDMGPPESAFLTPPEERVHGALSEDVIDHIELPESGGILIHYQNLPYPWKGCATPNIVTALGAVKGLLFDALRFAKSHPVLTLFLLPFHKAFKEAFLAYSDRFLSIHYLHPERYCQAARATYDLLEGYDRRLQYFAATLIEFDNAYRFRFQDILPEMQVHTKQELIRVMGLAAERERHLGGPNPHMTGKWHMMATLIRLMPQSWLQPALGRLEPERFRADEGDLYWMSLRTDYQFFVQRNAIS